MIKKYIVHLSQQERDTLNEIIKKQQGSYEKIRRAHILLKADANTANWKDKKIAQAYGCRTKTVENIRERLVKEGFELTLNGKKPSSPARKKLLDGQQESQIIALRLGKPPEGFANWSLRLLADKVVELQIVESISYETVRRTLKKTP